MLKQHLKTSRSSQAKNAPEEGTGCVKVEASEEAHLWNRKAFRTADG